MILWCKGFQKGDGKKCKDKWHFAKSRLCRIFVTTHCSPPVAPGVAETGRMLSSAWTPRSSDNIYIMSCTTDSSVKCEQRRAKKVFLAYAFFNSNCTCNTSFSSRPIIFCVQENLTKSLLIDVDRVVRGSRRWCEASEACRFLWWGCWGWTDDLPSQEDMSRQSCRSWWWRINVSSVTAYRCWKGSI